MCVLPTKLRILVYLYMGGEDNLVLQLLQVAFFVIMENMAWHVICHSLHYVCFTTLVFCHTAKNKLCHISHHVVFYVTLCCMSQLSQNP